MHLVRPRSHLDRLLFSTSPSPLHRQPSSRLLRALAPLVTCVATLLALVAPVTAHAEPEPPPLLLTFGPHPRLKHLNPDLFSDDPAALEQTTKHLTAAADAILANPIDVPKVGGNWIFYYSCPADNCQLVQNKDGKHVCPVCKKEYNDARTLDAFVTTIHYKVEDACQTLARAYWLTRKDAYAAEVIRMLHEYAKVYPGLPRRDRWGRTGMLAVIGGKRHIQSLEEATGGIKLAEAYDLVYDWPGLDAATRATIEKDFFGETVRTIYAFYALYDERNNHLTWYNAGVATIAAVLGNSEWLILATNGPKGLRHQFAASVTEDGLWYEGTIAYHYYALQAIIHHVDAAKACGIDLTGDPMLKKLFTFPLNLSYPNGQMPAYNDGDRTSIGGYRGMYTWAAKTWPDDAALQAFATTGQVAALPSAVYQASGYAYLRRGADAGAVTVAMDFGENGGHHGHPDKLQIVLYALGQELFLDPGRLTYRCPEYETWTRQTVAHNTVAINGKSQNPDTGSLLESRFTPDYDLAVAESTGAYAGTRLRRALVLLGDRVLVDLFEVKTGADSTVDWFLHGAAELKTPEGFVARPTPLGTTAGYQHLEGLQTQTFNAPFTVDWQTGKNGFVRTHLLLDRETEAITGKGIGYDLKSRVPLLTLRQVKTNSTTFATVQDFSGDGSAVTAVTRTEMASSTTLDLTVVGTAWRIVLDHDSGDVAVTNP